MWSVAKVVSSTSTLMTAPVVTIVGASSRKPTLSPKLILAEAVSPSLSVTVAVNVTAFVVKLMSSFGEPVPPVGWVKARS